jgi:hypothetical protein
VTVKTLNWPQAIVASAVLIIIAALIFAGKDTGALVTSGLAILGALGILVKQGAEVKERTDAVQAQTNGNTRELLKIIAQQQSYIIDMANKMATMPPPPTEYEPELAAPRTLYELHGPDRRSG